jgi:hypothetical protein
VDPHIILTKLYCVNSIKLIERGNGEILLKAFGVQHHDQLLKIPGYSSAFTLVSECAAIVNALSRRCPEPSDQLRESLRLLRGMVDDGAPTNKIEVTRKLVEGMLRNGWPSAHQELYDKKKEILEWRDFFVSYTNRDAPAINGQFRALIKGCLGASPKGQQLKENYLARVIARHLRSYQQLSGFFDNDNLEVGENIENRVDGYCTKAFALVQLIEPLSFAREPPTNWCFHEYTVFSGNAKVIEALGDKDRHFFILTDQQLGAIEPANPYPKYDKWAAHIANLKHLHIAVKNERNETLRGKIKKIATQIVALRSKTIDRWLI